jgi:hypothetical protein
MEEPSLAFPLQYDAGAADHRTSEAQHRMGKPVKKEFP